MPLQLRYNERDGASNHQPMIVYSAVYSGTDQRKHQSSASLAFLRGIRIHRWPVNSPHKWLVTQKMFPFDDVIMAYTPFPFQTPVLLHSSKHDISIWLVPRLHRLRHPSKATSITIKSWKKSRNLIPLWPGKIIDRHYGTHDLQIQSTSIWDI